MKVLLLIAAVALTQGAWSKPAILRRELAEVIDPAAKDCVLILNGTSLSYDNCKPTQNDLEYQLFWTFEPSELLDSDSWQFKVGLDAAQSNGWIGFGIPETPGEMIGANAMIIKTTSTSSTGATGRQFLMLSHDDPAKFKRGQLTIRNLTTEASEERLRASFIIKINSTNLSDGSLPIIYAVGTFTSTGQLAAHDHDGALSLPVNMM